jgi:hypothetical protein
LASKIYHQAAQFTTKREERLDFIDKKKYDEFIVDDYVKKSVFLGNLINMQQ